MGNFQWPWLSSLVQDLRSRWHHLAMNDSQGFLPPNILRAKKLAWLLDNAITLPVIKKKIGLDPILGTIPYAGDIIPALLGLYLIWVAYELNLPRKVMVRMLVNLLIDQLISIVPVVGDVTDIFWRANTMNLKILENAYLQGQRKAPDVVDIEAE